MRIAITGGTGFVGRHLAEALVAEGHEVVLIARGADQGDPALFAHPGVSFFSADLSDASRLAQAFAGCGAVAHLAGINREIGRQTYQRVHVAGTRHVVEAAGRAGVEKLALLSFLRARPDCGSAYHESKWAAEEVVRASGLNYTIVKAGVIYGRGDHMLDHLSHALHTFPVFLLVGSKENPMRPLAIEDLTKILRAALVEGHLSRQTVSVTGPEEMSLQEAARRVARVVGRRPPFMRAPVVFHYALAWLLERVMTIPLASLAQVRILSESLVEPLPPCDLLPADLQPIRAFTEEQIRSGLPPARAFGKDDFLCCASESRHSGALR